MSSVTLSDVDKFYGTVQVVHGINLDIKPQEFLVLVGPSGCGKSTTLRMIAGLEEISGGVVMIDEKPVNRVAPKDRDVAMVFQNYALYPHLNVADNIAFGLRIRKENKQAIKDAISEVSGILGLDEYLERKPSDLSGGQRQRVAMGRAIVRRPKVFLFDEPLSNLDAQLRTQMRAEIKRLHQRLGATSIYVTHDQVEAMTLADRIVVMHNGRIEQVGAPMDLFLNPANIFVASFLGAPPMNQIRAVVSHTDSGPVASFGGNQLPLPHLEALRNEAGKEIIVGVRPEFAQLADSSSAGFVPIDIDLVETLGSEALLHSRVLDEPFVVKADTLGGNSLSDVKGFTIPAELIRVFDAETGRSLAGQDRSV